MGVTAAVGRSWLCAETGERERRAECDLAACRSPTPRQTSAPVTMVKKPQWFRSAYLVLAGPLDTTLPDPGISPPVCRVPASPLHPGTQRHPYRVRSGWPQSVFIIIVLPFLSNHFPSFGYSDRTEQCSPPLLPKTLGRFSVL